MANKKKKKASPIKTVTARIVAKEYPDRKAAEHAVRTLKAKVNVKDELLKVVTAQYGPRGGTAAPTIVTTEKDSAPPPSIPELVERQMTAIDQNNDDFDLLQEEIEAQLQIAKLAEHVLHLAISRRTTRADILEKLAKAVSEFKF